MRKSALKKLLQLSVSLALIAGIILAAVYIKQSLNKGGEPAARTSASEPAIRASQQPDISIKPQPAKIIHDDGNVKRPTVIFTFDDGNESDFLLAYPILRKYGIEGTSYVNPYNADHNVEYKLSWNEIKQMYENGWDIGDHTYTHINLNKSTPDEIRRSMEEDNESFMRNGVPVPDVFAYPYGAYNIDNENIIAQYREQARLAFYRDDFVDLSNVNPYEIPCISADMQTDRLLKEHEKIVDKACTDNGVIVFRVHCMYRDKKGDTGNQPVETSSKLFAQLVNYCVNKGCGFTTMDGLINLYSGSGNGSESENQKIASYALETPWQESCSSDKYMFYSNGGGLYRADLDGLGKTLLYSGQRIKLAGYTGGYVYFTDSEFRLYKMSENGGQAGLLSETPIADAIILNGRLYCIQSGKICFLSDLGTLVPAITIPDSILTEAQSLRTDGNSLYLCIFFQQGLSDIYKCDLAGGNIALILKMVSDDPLVFKDGYIIKYDGNEVYKEDLQTGGKQALLSCSGMLLDMTSYKNWLVYITKPFDGDQKYINGYNMDTGKTFSVKSQGDWFYQTLPSEIVACDSEHKDALIRLTINGDSASLEDFPGNA